MGFAAYFTSEWLTSALPGRGEMVKLLRVTASISAGVLALMASAAAADRRVRRGAQPRAEAAAPAR
jgi:hypothetical protein